MRYRPETRIVEQIFKKTADRSLSVEEALNLLKRSETAPDAVRAEVIGDNRQILDVREFAYDEPLLRDHLMQGEQVLLGTTYCSMVIEGATARDWGAETVGIRKLFFERPLVVKSGERVRVVAELETRTAGHDHLPFTVRCSKNGGDDEIAARGELVLATDPLGRLDIEELRRGTNRKISGQEIYGSFPSNSIAIGPSLKTLQSVDCGSGETLGRLSLPNGSSDRLFDPTLINGAVMSSVFGIRPLASASYVPIMVKRLRWRDSLPSACWAHAVIRKENAELLIVDIDLCDDDGHVLLAMDELTLKRLRPAAATRSGEMAAAAMRFGANANMPVRTEETGLAGRVSGYLKGCVARVLDTEDAKVDGRRNFMDLGLDSVELVSLAQDLEKTLGVELFPTLFFEHQNIAELTEHLVAEHRHALEQYFAGADDPHPGSRTEQPAAGESLASRPARDASPMDSVPGNRDIAIIGMSGRFGGSRNLEEFWRNLATGKDLIVEVPPDHFDCAPWFVAGEKVPDKTYCRWGSFIGHVDKFEPAFFNISPREAQVMDPQLRLLMETLVHTADDAGYGKRIRGTNTGVYVGTCFYDYMQEMQRVGKVMGPHDGTGNSPTMMSNRPSFFFDLRGPSLTVDTACSSSLVALHLAVQALRRGECDMAFVGAANLLLCSWHYRYFSSIEALSYSGRCHSFDARADGYVPGEAVCSILLKPLKQALIDNDRIHAVIKGTAVNHGGRTQSVTAPSVKQEVQVIRQAWKDAGIAPDAIGYIEAHGTGTRLGDPIEIDAIKKCFGQSTGAERYCAVGSAKAHLGHTEGAAGLTGVIKAVLSLQHKTIPAMPMLGDLNPFIRLDDSPLQLNRQTQPWPRPLHAPRSAGVNSFGFGGTYAHVVVQEFEADSVEEPAPDRDLIFILSARNVDRLKDCCVALLDFLRRPQQPADLDATPPLVRIEATLLLGREEMDCRMALLARTKQELEMRVATFLQGVSDPATTFFAETPAARHDRDAGRDVSRLFESGDLAALAELWVRGARIDWRVLYDGRPPPPVSLFEYPFARERHWFAIPEDRAATGSPTGQVTATDRFRGQGQQGGQQYVPCLIWSDLAEQSGAPRADGCLLVFGDGGEVQERLIEWADTHETRVVLVKPAETFRRLGTGDFEIGTRSENDYRDLFGTLIREGVVVTQVLHLWALGSGDSERAAADLLSIAEIRARGIDSVFHILKGLGEQCRKLGRFLYAFGERHPSEMPYLESLGGYGKSLAASYPNLAFSVVRFQPAADAVEIFAGVLAELGSDPRLAGDEVSYVKGRRLIRGVKQIDLRSSSSAVPALRAGDTVLVTGGAGVLGLICARHLTARYGIRAVLMGRSMLVEQQLAAFEDPQQETMVYLQGDVTDRRDVERALQTIKSRYGRLDAVIHAAGTIGGAAIDKQNFAGFQEGLKAKIDGLVNLDEVTRHEPLRLFMVFSSLSSILGDFGQCNYAVANRFCDAYGELRERLRASKERVGRTLVVNWPLWRAGNSHSNLAAEELYLRSAGIAYLETERGCQILDTLLSTDYSQVIPVEGDLGRIPRLFGSMSTPAESAGPAASIAAGTGRPPGLVLSEPPNVSLPTLSRRVRQILAELLAIDEDALPLDGMFSEFGVDSIILKEFAAKLGTLFDVNIPPNVLFSYPSIVALSEYLMEQSVRGEVEGRNLANGAAAATARPVIGVSQRPSPGNATVRPPAANEIAVIGMSAKFPGACDTEEFWRVLENKQDVVREIPAERWDWRSFYDGSGVRKNRSISKWGGFLQDADCFDAAFFNISPAEAEVMDPQHRVFLETSWKAVEDAGYAVSNLAGRSVGVFAGVQFNDYQNLIWEAGDSRPQTGTGNSHAMLANRVSFLFDLRGPSEAIDTACSSSLVALHRAARSLVDEECELALAGGISLITNAQQYIVASQLGMLSPDGRCKTFDARADGFVKGEGVGVLLLKPLARALADGDHIYAVVKGSAVNHGGRTSSLTAPEASAQANVIRAAIKHAGVDAATIGYVEAHGTGTELGDPIEIEGLKQAFESVSGPVQTLCAIGSVKTNIGHLESGSGIASVIKTVLSLNNRKIPGTPHFQMLNPHIQLGDRFFVAAETIPWPAPKDGQGQVAPRRAGVSAFGFGGSNAHLILEEFEPSAANPASAEATQTGTRSELIVLSAKSDDRLRAYAARLREWCAARLVDGPVPSLRDVAFTLQVGRDEMDERLAIEASDLAELGRALEGYLKAIDHGRVYRGTAAGRRSTIEKRLATPEGGDAIAQVTANLVASRKWGALAELWVGGARVNWSLLERSPTARRISLPGYPFARDRHWIAAPRPEPALLQSPDSAESQINVIAIDGRTFAAKLRGRAGFVSDHIIDGRGMLAATAHLEVARLAGEAHQRAKVNYIRDVVWARPVLLKSQQVDLYIRLTPDAGDLEFEISPEASFSSGPYSRGRLCFASAGLPATLAIFDDAAIAQFRTRCSNVTSGQECYRALAASGYRYGPAYRSIRELRSSSSEVVADLVEPAESSPRDSVIRLPLLDGAFQSIIGPSLHDPSDSMMLPYAAGEVAIFDAMTQVCSSYLTLKGIRQTAQNGLRKADVVVVNSDGRMSLAIHDLSFMEFSRGSAAGSKSTSLGRPTVPDDIASSAIDESQSPVQIIALLRQVVAEETRIPYDKISASAPFETYGIDSVMILALTRRLEGYFGRLSKTLLFEYRSIAQLASHLGNLTTRQPLPQGHAGGKPAESSAAGVSPVQSSRSSKARSENNGPSSPKCRGAVPSDAIAIIGLSGRYPMAEDLDAFWTNLVQSRDCISEIPQTRWDHARVFSPEKGRLGATYGKWGGFLEHVDQFDAELFNIAPRDALWIDPQERLFLESAWLAVEDAGYTRAGLSGSRVGVFVGVMYGHYQLLDVQIEGRTMNPGVSYASVANRVSYTFDFNGPSIALDTMCSSSVTAIKLACDSIRSGESDLAIAGGVNVTIHPSKYTFLSQGMYLASDGRSRAFGAGGDGYVPGEGVGAVILKPLARAIADRDHIYGVIKAVAINHGGKTHGYTVPNPTAQSAVIRAALEQAEVHPRAISFIEAHGTGTALGDPIEISGLSKAFEGLTGDRQFCAIGSVKSNIGHLESAAGIAGLTKVLLQMKHKMLVPTLHAEAANPHIEFSQTPFFLQRTVAPWERAVIEIEGRSEVMPRLAGISSFGAGGSNAHIVVEEYMAQPETALTPAREQLIVLSARSKPLLRESAERLRDFVRRSAGSEEVGPGTATVPVVQGVRTAIAFILDVAEAEIVPDAPLGTCGFDAGHYTMLAEALSNRFNILVTAASFREAHSVLAVARIVSQFVQGKNLTGEQSDGEQPISVRLDRIAFTLQTGREVARERAAWVVGSIDELELRLRQFCGDAPMARGTDRCYVGTVAVTNDEPLRSTVVRDAKELDLLAQVWVSGAEVDWMSLYPAGVPGRISLPPSPLARRRYWVDSHPQAERTPATRTHGAGNAVEAIGEEIRGAIDQELRSSLAKVLMMDVSDVDVHRPFEELGMASVAAVDWVNIINRRYYVSIDPTSIYDHPTLDKFARYVKSMVGETPQDRQSPAGQESRISDNDRKVPSHRKLTDFLNQVRAGAIDLDEADQLLTESLLSGDAA